MKQISILGCGWLGFPLAKALVKEGFKIKGSTTSLEKKVVLENADIQSFKIELKSDQQSENIEAFLEGSSILIVAIPPKLRGKDTDYTGAEANSFVKKIKNLLPQLEKSSVKQLLFVSSTAVYGETNSDIDENTTPIPVTESGKQLLEVETLLMEHKQFQTTILRFGGLIGQDRNPARFLAGKVNLPNPEGAINLIHQNDCIGIILKIISNSSWGEIYNGVADYHPTRADYYTQKAVASHLVPPSFDYSKISVGKTILSNKVQEQLGYTFSVKNL